MIEPVLTISSRIDSGCQSVLPQGSTLEGPGIAGSVPLPRVRPRAGGRALHGLAIGRCGSTSSTSGPAAPPPPRTGPWSLTGSARRGPCTDVANGATTNGIPIQLCTCNGTGYQPWRATACGQLVNHPVRALPGRSQLDHQPRKSNSGSMAATTSQPRTGTCRPCPEVVQPTAHPQTDRST